MITNWMTPKNTFKYWLHLVLQFTVFICIAAATTKMYERKKKLHKSPQGSLTHKHSHTCMFFFVRSF